jgi:hypothetical protein
METANADLQHRLVYATHVVATGRPIPSTMARLYRSARLWILSVLSVVFAFAGLRLLMAPA